eukprot:CAMPEP_0202695820 /NCGR_PEP_ID=MMETSP1385-20130828/9297_1 /ASSEMBLY_ACC=CAM_ASM_000861 /TAXON_ID=933848 /ORGANISM="Elphidium margaritaceum" /LENGTH=355 /DNA_ID=CAMNT_0049351897 /DNA_START=145 /DNA_END=1212 /DNA_ORIENTATION=-
MPTPEYGSMPVQVDSLGAPKAHHHSQVVYEAAIPHEPQIVRPNVSNVVVQQPPVVAMASGQNGHPHQHQHQRLNHQRRNPNPNQNHNQLNQKHRPNRNQNLNQNQRQPQRQNHFHTTTTNNHRGNFPRGGGGGGDGGRSQWYTHNVAHQHNTNRGMTANSNTFRAQRPQSIPNGYRAFRGHTHNQQFRSFAQVQQHPYKRPVQFQPRARNLPAAVYVNGGNQFQQQRMRNQRRTTAGTGAGVGVAPRNTRFKRDPMANRKQRGGNPAAAATGGVVNGRNQHKNKGKNQPLSAAALDRDLDAYLMKNPDTAERQHVLNANLDKELDDYWKHNHEDNEEAVVAAAAADVQQPANDCD